MISFFVMFSDFLHEDRTHLLLKYQACVPFVGLAMCFPSTLFDSKALGCSSHFPLCRKRTAFIFCNSALKLKGKEIQIELLAEQFILKLKHKTYNHNDLIIHQNISLYGKLLSSLLVTCHRNRRQFQIKEKTCHIVRKAVINMKFSFYTNNKCYSQ